MPLVLLLLYKVSALETLTVSQGHRTVSQPRRHSLSWALAAEGIPSPPVPSPPVPQWVGWRERMLCHRCSVCSLSCGQTVLGVLGWRRQEGMSLPCLLLLCLPADLQGNGLAQWLQLFFSYPFSSSSAQRGGKVHPLGLPWVGW